MPDLPRNIILVGFMGTGKSAVARALARRLGWECVDTDALVEAVAGRPIPEIFAAWGEERFRDLETGVLRPLAAGERQVIATGGGVLLRDGNVALLRAAGPLVCLTARPETILRRVSARKDRPLLAGAEDPLAEIRRLLAERAPRYALADLTLDTCRLSVQEVIEQLCSALPSLSRGQPTKSSSTAA